jgi:ribosomal protein S18 acetylase RimI-like enzyme
MKTPSEAKTCNAHALTTFQTEHTDAFGELMKQHISTFNAQHWDASGRQRLGLKQLDADGQLCAGLAGRSFGLWCQIENFWVREDYRGQGLGARMLAAAEAIAWQRGCRYILLDTLDFQAPAFYQKQGYVVVWQQQQYPQGDGCKYFLVKTKPAFADTAAKVTAHDHVRSATGSS